MLYSVWKRDEAMPGIIFFHKEKLYMNCALCSSSIPAGLSECPGCGTSISYSISDVDFLPSDEAISQPPLLNQATPQTPRLVETSWIPPHNTAPFQEMKPSQIQATLLKGGDIGLFSDRPLITGIITSISA
jgi:hypothetical protein